MLSSKTGFILIFVLGGYFTAVAQEKWGLPYEQFIKKLEKTKGMLIDARTPKEYEAGHLTNSVLIDFNAPEFVENITKLDRKGHYFLYCRSGNRTARALAVMQELGFKRIYHLKGGVVGINQEDVLVKD